MNKHLLYAKITQFLLNFESAQIEGLLFEGDLRFSGSSATLVPPCRGYSPLAPRRETLNLGKFKFERKL